MAGRNKARKSEEKAKNNATTSVKYVSPLNRLCESVKNSREHQISEVESDGYASNVVIAFPTNGEKQIISLDNGIDNQANDTPPLPPGPPPVTPPVQNTQTPTTSGASTSGSNDNMQGFMLVGLATLSK